MKTYTATNFTGHYPVGTAAVVRANSQQEAAEALNSTLRDQGLEGDAKPEDMLPLPLTDRVCVRLLNDGNY